MVKLQGLWALHNIAWFTIIFGAMCEDGSMARGVLVSISCVSSLAFLFTHWWCEENLREKADGVIELSNGELKQLRELMKKMGDTK